jgi:hypothetical protein
MRAQTSGAVLVSRGALMPKQMEQRQQEHQQLRRQQQPRRHQLTRPRTQTQRRPRRCPRGHGPAKQAGRGSCPLGARQGLGHGPGHGADLHCLRCTFAKTTTDVALNDKASAVGPVKHRSRSAKWAARQAKPARWCVWTSPGALRTGAGRARRSRTAHLPVAHSALKRAGHWPVSAQKTALTAHSIAEFGCVA